MALTNKELAFVAHYIQRWNGAQAARLAGYSEKSAKQIASKLLKKKGVQKEIQDRLDALKLDGQKVLALLAQQATGSMEDYIAIDKKSGEVTLDFKKAQRGQRLNLVKSLKISRETRVDFNSETDKGEPGEILSEKFEFELYDAQAALGLLGKAHKLFTDKVEHTDARDEAIRAIRSGDVDYEYLAEELGKARASELFRDAGVPIPAEAGERTSQDHDA